MEAAAPVVFRLSSLQKTLWSHPELRGASVYAVATLDGALDAGKLKASLTQVAERHESLRTFFQVQPGFTFPFQVVRETPDFGWESRELQTGEIKPDEIAGLLEPAAWPVMTPLEGPAFAVRLLAIAADKHVLVVRALALCCDHVSLGKLLAEAAQHYAGEAVEENVQYADFAEWHNEALTATGEDADAAKNFWAAQAPAAVAPLGLAAAGTGLPARYEVTTAGAPTEAHLLGAWQALLWRLGGQEGFAVDVLETGRPLEDLELSIGLFARPFTVSSTLEAGAASASLEAGAEHALAEVRRYEAFYAEEPKGAVAFEYLQLPGSFSAGGVTFTVTHLEPLRWPAKLTLTCENGACALLYDSAAYAPETVARLAGYLQKLLAAPADSPVAAVDLLDPGERELLVTVCNQTGVTFADTRPFPQLFEAQAELTPGLAALTFTQTTLTYAELNARANQLAHALRAAGVEAGSAVGLCLERGAGMIVALLAILKAGGAYVPLLPDLPAARLAHQIDETGIGVIVTAEPLLARLAGFAGRTICLDRDEAKLAAETTENLPATATPDDLAYILYTSGSTGTPKGVAVRHRNLTNYTLGIVRLLGLEALSTDAGLTFATVSTLGADLGNTAIFPPLVTGGCLQVIGYEAAIDATEYAALQRAHPADVLKITPSNLAALLAGGAQAAEILPKKFLLVGGEACRWELVEAVRKAGSCRMFNHYGPTETTIGCLVQELSGGSSAATAFAPLGLPLPNQQVYVLDALLQPQPAGVAGEICVAGAGVTAGYRNRPEETAKRFVANPFGAGLLYRTGDLGRRLAGGAIEFLGRVDDQVKIRGYRVELGEIEAVLHGVAGVKQAVVLMTQDPGAGDHLTAYVAASPAPAAAALQEHLRAQLPEYMVPRDVVVLEQMPLSANGKIDRRALAEMKPGAAKAQAELLAPRTELEAQLVAIWAETLRVESVGIRDNFFDLGGHSLLATQIISRVRAGLGVQVSIRMLFEAPTVESLAAAIETTRAPAAAGEDDLDDLLAELEGLSDAEAEEMLGGGRKSGE